MSDTLRVQAQNGAVLRGEGREEPLDLDAIEARANLYGDPDLFALISELRRLRESNEKLLDLNLGFMGQNRLLREENGEQERLRREEAVRADAILRDKNLELESLRKALESRVRELTAAAESAYCVVKPDGCDCGTDEPGTCALCLIEALREKGWVA